MVSLYPVSPRDIDLRHELTKGVTVKACFSREWLEILSLQTQVKNMYC